MSGLAPLHAAPLRTHPLFEPAPTDLFDRAANLFFGAKAGESTPHWGDRGPAFAVDGRHDAMLDHWGAENLPVHLTLDLETPRELNAIRFWTVWGAARYYQYKIEGSRDGENWILLVDETANTTPATSDGRVFQFPAQPVRYVRTTITKNSISDAAGGHIVEIEGYRLPDEIARRYEDWDEVDGGLHGAVVGPDARHPRDTVPDLAALAALDDAPEAAPEVAAPRAWTTPWEREAPHSRRPPAAAGAPRAWTATAWRGERVHTQLLLWTREGAPQTRLAAPPLRRADGETLPASALRARFVRYVLADGALVADPLDTATRLDVAPRSVRPVWVSVDVPADAAPGRYETRLAFEAQGGNRVEFDLAVEVLPLVLPPPAEWAFHLDLWQNPFSVARYHGVEPWSEAHWLLLEPVTRLLAEAGQKVVTVAIVHHPWGGQTYDAFESMIEWIRRPDGTWAYDYTVFDRFVEFNDRCGIRGQISAYSMVPWTNTFRYMDAATGDYRVVEAEPGTPAYEEHWRPFLADFTRHLKARGWFERTVMAMDERAPAIMRQTIDFLHEAAPGLRVGLAGDDHEELDADLHDFCVVISEDVPRARIAARDERGAVTTFYVCCVPARPNTFTVSPPAEATWLGWHAAARGYSGFLRWAYNSWVADPLIDTSHVSWTAGDCFLVYPGPRSSIRFERLREGIQDYEKIRLLKARLAARADAADARRTAEPPEENDAAWAAALGERLRAALDTFDWTSGADPATACADVVNAARRVLDEIARRIVESEGDAP